MSQPMVVKISHHVPGAQQVDRSTDWGNPFVMCNEADRDRVCDLYEQYATWRLTVEPDWLQPLRGKTLACWCAPKRCHADTLLRLANQSQEGQAMSQDEQDVCGFCGLPGADKVPHPVRWPDEASAGSDYVHADCEDAECQRAHSLLTDKQREQFLRSL